MKAAGSLEMGFWFEIWMVLILIGSDRRFHGPFNAELWIVVANAALFQLDEENTLQWGLYEFHPASLWNGATQGKSKVAL
jgi:hypothetical protein